MSLFASPPSCKTAGEGRQPSLFPAWEAAAIRLADPCAHKHAGAETSVQAHERIKPHKREIHEKIVALVVARGAQGATVHELAEAFETFPSNISGRLTELRMLGRLTYKLDESGARLKRRGACVLVVG